MSKRSRYPEIKLELCQREQESRAIRKQINGSSGLERWGFWMDKRRYGSDTRDLLLGYAFLRGRAYRDCEIKTAPGSGPYVSCIQHCLEARGHLFEKEAIKVWLETEKTSESAQEAA